MAVECVNSTAYVGKILSERRKVSFKLLVFDKCNINIAQEINSINFCNFLRLFANSLNCFL